MTRRWNTPDPDPTPAELAAWAEGELDAGKAARIEAWLRDHPEALSETLAQSETDRQIVSLFRAHPPADPSHAAWQETRSRLRSALPTAPRPRWPGYLLGLLVAAALLGGLAAANLFLPISKNRPVEQPDVAANSADDEPFLVATASEVEIISMDARDADRVFVGEPLLDSLDFAASEDIELVNLEDEPDDGRWPSKLQRGSRMPMVVIVRADEEP